MSSMASQQNEGGEHDEYATAIHRRPTLVVSAAIFFISNDPCFCALLVSLLLVKYFTIRN